MQRFLFIERVLSSCPVLDGEDTEDTPTPQDRHAQIGMIDLLPRLRAKRKSGMRLGIVEVDRSNRTPNQANQAFSGLHVRIVNGIRIKPLRRIELK